MKEQHPKKSIVGTVESRELGLKVDIYLGADKKFHAYFPSQFAPHPRVWDAGTYAEIERGLNGFFDGLREVVWHPEIVIELLLPFGEHSYSATHPRPHAGMKAERQWRGEFTNPDLVAATHSGRTPYLTDSPEEIEARFTSFARDIWTWVVWYPPCRGVTLPYSDVLWEGLQKADAELRRVHIFLATVQDLGKTEEGRLLIAERFTGKQLEDSQRETHDPQP